MKNSYRLTLPILTGLCLLSAALRPSSVEAARHHDRNYSAQKQETVEKSFTLPAGAHNSLDIDNIFGSIEVTGGSGNQVHVVVTETWRGESDAAVDRARKEVSLDISQDAGAVKFYVNGPFRCHDHGSDCCCCDSSDDRNYSVKMDFKVEVPAQIDVEARTVNEGHVRISNVAGKFLVRNVNGGIELNSMGGSGSARTVNGPVTVSFRQNPRENSDFKSINGAVELRFAPGLSADFRFKNFNGGIYSDFPVTALPARDNTVEHQGGKVIFRADRYSAARIGSGGPEVQVENLNGEIRILENHE